MLPDRIELSTSPLPMECSTTELRQHARYRGIGQKAPHSAAGSCHKGPSGASMRAGLEGAKWGKNRRWPPANRGKSGLIRFPTAPSRRIMARMASPAGLAADESGGRDQQAIATRRHQTHYVRRCRSESRQICFDRGNLDGLAMTGEQGRGAGKTGADTKDSRRDRLKLALRENLKRRKSQARGRSDADAASSESSDFPLGDASGEKPGS